MCVQYIRGCSVHQGCSVHWGLPWAHRGDSMSTSGDVPVHQRDTMSILGDIQYIRGIPWVHQEISWVYQQIVSTSGMFSTLEFSIEIERVLSSWYNPDVLIVSLQCTEHPPMYSWYPRNVLMISPLCTEHPWCTEHPLMYLTSPNVLNTHYTGWCSFWVVFNGEKQHLPDDS